MRDGDGCIRGQNAALTRDGGCCDHVVPCGGVAEQEKQLLKGNVVLLREGEKA